MQFHKIYRNYPIFQKILLTSALFFFYKNQQSLKKSPGDWSKIGFKLGTKHETNFTNYTKSKQILYRKRISMLTGLKGLSFACIWVFYRPESNAMVGPHATEF